MHAKIAKSSLTMAKLHKIRAIIAFSIGDLTYSVSAFSHLDFKYLLTNLNLRQFAVTLCVTSLVALNFQNLAKVQTISITVYLSRCLL